MIPSEVAPSSGTAAGLEPTAWTRTSSPSPTARLSLYQPVKSRWWFVSESVFQSVVTPFLALKHWPYHMYWQAILDKFEFFPIKCKVLRARDNFQKYQRDLESARLGGCTPKKAKVSPEIFPSLFQCISTVLVLIFVQGSKIEEQNQKWPCTVKVWDYTKMTVL